MKKEADIKYEEIYKKMKEYNDSLLFAIDESKLELNKKLNSKVDIIENVNEEKATSQD